MIDRAAARHVEQIVGQYYRGRIPPRIVRHLDALAASAEVGTESEAAQPQSGHDLIGTATAAKLLGCKPRYVRCLAADLDGVQVDGDVWIFDRATVIEYALAKAEGRKRDCA